jgi:hypothetical protein
MRWIKRLMDRRLARRNDRFRTDGDLVCSNIYWGNNVSQASSNVHGQIACAIVETTEFDDDTHVSGVVLKHNNEGVHWVIAWTPYGRRLCVHFIMLDEVTEVQEQKKLAVTMH